jgi:outer membrane protein OmpA-like peptidoglycan-associated protein
MKNIIGKISIIGMILAFSHVSIAAESLYGSKVQSRLIDEDRDGVIAARDLCPNTPSGSSVDNNGCSSQTTRQVSSELNIFFDSGKSELKPRFYPELKGLVTFLKNNPTSTVVIEGHTDNKGSAESNKVLSQERATAISDVLIDSFRIKPDRVKGIGYGANRPITDNNTEAGREQNRRVVAEIVAEQKVVNERWTIYSVDDESSIALNKSY